MALPDPASLAGLVVATAAAGIFAGLIAGLFGVGGGTVIVPALFYAFAVLGLGGEANLHVAIGTSLAVIIASSWRSLRAHRTHGAVDETVLRTWSPWVALGGAIGAVVAGVISKAALGAVYAVVVAVVAAHMAFWREDRPLAKDLPTGGARGLVATVIGALSAMMGVGGGAMGAMVMTLCGRPIHQAVATASGFGLAIGIPAALGFVISGWGAAERPPLSLGYVNLPGAAILALLTTTAAPYGAKLAHSLDRRTLRRAFAAFLAVTAVSVAWKAMG